MRIGYSYYRFSSTAQEDGDSIRRQSEAAKAWCERNNVQLDESTTYEDRATSAYTGKNRKSGALSRFLEEIKAGRIPRGSVLIIENLDRISREDPWDAIPLLSSIVSAGISVVTLSPSEMVYARGKDFTPLILAVCEFGRGHNESALKGERIAAAWDEKKRKIRNGDGVILTKKLPAWICEKDGKLALIPEHAKTVRNIFKMAIDGYGLYLIVKKLIADGVKPIATSKPWSKAYIHNIITGRVVLGELQPIKVCNSETKALKAYKWDGSPIVDYYPAVIDENTWLKAQAALAQRKAIADRKGRPKGGRTGEKVANLFAGIIWDARSGSRITTALRKSASRNWKMRRMLVQLDAYDGRARTVRFPAAIFEQAFFDSFREISPSDILGDGEPEYESTAITLELAAIQGRMKKIEDELTGDGEDVPALVKVMKALDVKEQELLRKLAEARQKESAPQAAAWGEAKSLLETASTEKDRLRLRTLLQQIVERIDVLIVPRKTHRLCAVQARFIGGGHRDYLIHYWTAGNGRTGGWESMSAKWPDDDKDGLDLRKSEHVKRMEVFLQELDLQRFQQGDGKAAMGVE